MNLIERLPNVKGTYRANANLSKTTWFGVGGEAEILYRPLDDLDLSNFLKNIDKDIPITILGVGSNILIRDGGIKGVVIKLGRNFTEIKIEDSILVAGAAALNFNVANFCYDHSLSGLEFLIGIPGSIGGGIAMNAGAYNSDVSSVLIKAEVIDPDGNIITLRNQDIGFIYRGNSLEKGWIFTKGYYKVNNELQKNILEKMEFIRLAREKSQPIRSKTSGSTFKNPVGMKAWELIDKAGCRGLKIGDAIISELHCNFMINQGNASAADLENLGEEVIKRVKNTSGVELEWEIEKVGEKNG